MKSTSEMNNNYKTDVEHLIKDEHLYILNKIASLYNTAQTDNQWVPLIKFCNDYVENNHHKKEEHFIFEAIKDNPLIRAGGPLCTLYFDTYLQNSPLKIAQRKINNLLSVKLEPLWSEQLKPIISQNSPLAIPAEDHEAGRILLRAIQSIDQSRQTPETKMKLTQLFECYIEIQKEHFDREEKCFLQMCKEITPKETWENLLVNMNKHYKPICD